MSRVSNGNLGLAIVILAAALICSVALYCLVETDIVGIAGSDRAQDTLDQVTAIFFRAPKRFTLEIWKVLIELGGRRAPIAWARDGHL
jgi:hypothetical protein